MLREIHHIHLSAKLRIDIDKISQFVFTFLIVEMFLGGSGRFTEITPLLTLRMVLWLLGLFLTAVYILRYSPIKPDVLMIISLYYCSLLCSALIGIINQVPTSLLFLDIKQFCYFVIILFFALVVNRESKIEKIVRLIRRSSLLLAALHIIITTTIFLNLFNFGDVWQFFNVYLMQGHAVDGEQTYSSEVFFKGEYGLINYKGDFYMCVGFFFWRESKTTSKTIAAQCAVALAIILTGTRGFVLMMVATYVLGWMLYYTNVKNIIKSTTLLILTLTFLLAGLYTLYLFNAEYEQYIGDKGLSDSIRYLQIESVFDLINPISFFVGHGLGFGVASNISHMEIAFLEVFHKQGIVGLAVWLFILVYVFKLYIDTRQKPYAKAFWLAVLFTYSLSFTNPYVNHPLGFTIIGLAIVSLGVYKSQQRPANSAYNKPVQI